MRRHRPIFPGRFQPSILGTDELNFRVRNGNGWTLAVKDTDYVRRSHALQSFFIAFAIFELIERDRRKSHESK